MGEGIVRKLEMDMDGRTALFKMDNQPSPTTKHEGLCSVSRGSLDGRGVWGRMDACINIRGLSPFAVQLKCHSIVNQLCSIKNKRFKMNASVSQVLTAKRLRDPQNLQIL